MTFNHSRIVCDFTQIPTSPYPIEGMNGLFLLLFVCFNVPVHASRFGTRGFTSAVMWNVVKVQAWSIDGIAIVR